LRRRIVHGGGIHETPAIVYEAQALLIATWKNMVLHVWTDRATPVLVDVLDDTTRRFTSLHPEGFSAVHLVVNNTPLPEKGIRERLSELTERYAKDLACLCHIVEGSGFWASALQSFLTSLHVFSRAAFKLHICGDIPAAARWLPAPHAEKTKVSFTSAEFEEALSFVRRRVQTT
jgi:hypothetical protein